jgi:hypothetical protein
MPGIVRRIRIAVRRTGASSSITRSLRVSVSESANRGRAIESAAAATPAGQRISKQVP